MSNSGGGGTISSNNNNSTKCCDEDATVAPRRYIYNDMDMKEFMESSTKKDLLCVIQAMGKSCSSSSLSEQQYDYDPSHPIVGLSTCMASLHGSLSHMEEHWMNDFPPISAEGGPTRLSIRFGNPSFRNWYHRLQQRSYNIVSCMLQYRRKKNTSLSSFSTKEKEEESLLLQEAWECGYKAAATDTTTTTTTTTPSSSSSSAAETTTEGTGATTTATSTSCTSTSSCTTTSSMMDDEETAVVQELVAYLQDSFGHPIRLDYGTGHESSFMVFLYSLCKLGCIDEQTTTTQPPSMLKLKATTLSIFHQYLKVTRPIQKLYRLEPAGSHGVWGLDDYHCLPFYFGACQLQQQQQQQDNYYQSPNCIHELSSSNQDNNKYLYFSCIQFIKELKQGVPFFEHSPMLYDISQLPSWQKVSTGLLRLYEGEVLNKRQVVQHFKFGKLFKATWTPSQLPREPPTTNFRDPAVDGNLAVGTGDFVLPPTRAPWATNNTNINDQGGLPPPTRAPWAK